MELAESIQQLTILLKIKRSVILTYQVVDVPTGIQYMLQNHLNLSEGELRCLKRSDLVELCYHNMFRELDLMWNHHHKLSKNHN